MNSISLDDIGGEGEHLVLVRVENSIADGAFAVQLLETVSFRIKPFFHANPFVNKQNCVVSFSIESDPRPT